MKEALKLALEALEKWGVGYDEGYMKGWNDAMDGWNDAMDEKPAEASEPVATVVESQYEDGSPAGNLLEWSGRNEANDLPVGTKLYTTPKQHSANALKPLTDEQIYSITGVENRDEMMHRMARNIARAIEAAHNIKE